MPVRYAKEPCRQKLSSEVQGLSEMDIEKIIKMIHLLKTEFIGEKQESSLAGFRKARGRWKNVDVDNIYKKLNEDWSRWKPLKSV